MNSINIPGQKDKCHFNYRTFYLTCIHNLTLAFVGDMELCLVNEGLESRGLESLLDKGGRLASLFLLVEGV